jgi:hypothetical protein
MTAKTNRVRSIVLFMFQSSNPIGRGIAGLVQTRRADGDHRHRPHDARTGGIAEPADLSCIETAGRRYRPLATAWRGRRRLCGNATGGHAPATIASSTPRHRRPHRGTDHHGRHCIVGSSPLPSHAVAPACAASLPSSSVGPRGRASWGTSRLLARFLFWCSLTTGEARGCPRGRRPICPQ